MGNGRVAAATSDAFDGRGHPDAFERSFQEVRKTRDGCIAVAASAEVFHHISTRLTDLPLFRCIKSHNYEGKAADYVLSLADAI